MQHRVLRLGFFAQRFCLYQSTRRFQISLLSRIAFTDLAAAASDAEIKVAQSWIQSWQTRGPAALPRG